MPFCQLFYHLVWATKHREPMLLPEIEPIIHDLLRAKAIGLGGTVFAVNGIADHVHMVVSIPPSIAVSKFVGQVKATAATKFNKSDFPASIGWQDEYGAFSFDAKRLPNYIAYVQRQKEHHAKGDQFAVLERTQGEVSRLLREDAAIYTFEEAIWLEEMRSLDAELANLTSSGAV